MNATARKLLAGIAVTVIAATALTGAAAATSSAEGHSGTVAQATKEYQATMVGTHTKEW